uniref:Uncharacterized protein n=1 Tax=Arundo donax TaxID=35708 RepID=A0A0A9CXB6_ARUDO
MKTVNIILISDPMADKRTELNNCSHRRLLYQIEYVVQIGGAESEMADQGGYRWRGSLLLNSLPKS